MPARLHRPNRLPINRNWGSGSQKGGDASGGGKRRWAFEATVRLNLGGFGVQWHRLMEVGSLAAGDEVAGET